MIRVLASGLDGYLLKDADPEDVLAAVHSAAGGALVVGRERPRRWSPRLPPPPYRRAGRSRRPRPGDPRADGRGLPTSQVAARLYLAPKTIRNRVSEMLGRFGVASREEAITLGRAAGLGKTADSGRSNGRSGTAWRSRPTGPSRPGRRDPRDTGSVLRDTPSAQRSGHQQPAPHTAGATTSGDQHMKTSPDPRDPPARPHLADERRLLPADRPEARRRRCDRRRGARTGRLRGGVRPGPQHSPGASRPRSPWPASTSPPPSSRSPPTRRVRSSAWPSVPSRSGSPSAPAPFTQDVGGLR